MVVIFVGCGVNNKPPNYFSYHQNESYSGCRNQQDGSRLGYHFAQNSSWISDCDIELKREYWRIFDKSSGTYFIPRPDGGKTILDACKRLEPWIATLIEKYDLCNLFTKMEQVRRINSMPIRDALLLSHYLHSNLRFRVIQDKVIPDPLPDDVLIACKTQQMTDKFKEICDVFKANYYPCEGRLDTQSSKSSEPLLECVIVGNPIIPHPSVLADRMNELYGISE